MAMSASYGSLGFVEQVGSIYDWKNTIIIHQLPHNSVFTTGYTHTHTMSKSLEQGELSAKCCYGIAEWKLTHKVQ